MQVKLRWTAKNYKFNFIRKFKVQTSLIFWQNKNTIDPTWGSCFKIFLSPSCNFTSLFFLLIILYFLYTFSYVYSYIFPSLHSSRIFYLSLYSWKRSWYDWLMSWMHSEKERSQGSLDRYYSVKKNLHIETAKN